MALNPVIVQKFLKGVDYPATFQDIIDKATENGAPEDIMNALRKMGGGEFKSPAEVTKKMSETGE